MTMKVGKPSVKKAIPKAKKETKTGAGKKKTVGKPSTKMPKN